MIANLQVKCLFFVVVCQCCLTNCTREKAANKEFRKISDTQVKHTVEKENISKNKPLEELINKADSLEKNRMEPGSIKNPNSYTIVGGWRLTKFHTDTIEILEDRTPHIVISMFSMKIYGTDGCNSIGSDILNFKKDQIKFDYIVRTKKACGIGYDSSFLNLLAETRKYEVIESDQLFFQNEAGDVLLEFKRATYDYFKNY